ncbi:CMP-N-acetylneuraminate-beta-galactosamide-alpha-2,3-sialyltransferase 1-like isoform X2 [Denticeps clupeoides]|uniref:CMP-N-acetylneuraminate-beta-galactosamide-alpha-2,3-sialyltransferase 1 n=1 Tax=Denticeps clupeoides TaxID=299321 RepID=A0A8C4AR37_9TELE|nr:CMP-N-acetylneuraminate-beta-galactosamide-alpha-2,3-sialyltransferase 1-like isoform X2 [Denticeps clupeoides]XP_028821035.1 CMP-N-acetylneuraminate-beta-galactosamide-alpha-2,3-sialyltransferase 1-like isoform X2 [Denticeps clupeoides]
MSFTITNTLGNYRSRGEPELPCPTGAITHTGAMPRCKKANFLALTCVAAFLVYASQRYLSPRPCGCGRCVASAEDETWFRRRFDPSVSPLLSRRSSALSWDTYRWWKALQYASGKAKYEDIVEKLFQLIPDKEHYTEVWPSRCRTCSVVGNSGNLKGSGYGPLIDASDFVMRINRGRTEGFEDDVGTRTTHRIVYPETAMDVDNSTQLIVFAFKILDLEWLLSVFTTHTVSMTYQPVKTTLKVNRDKVMVLNPNFLKYVHENWLDKKGSYPSTGFLTLMMSLHICDRVKLFGFGANKNGDWDHYFEKVKPNIRTGVHAGRVEYEMINSLSMKKKIEMFRGW